jgi:hypothetical protein
MSSVSLLHLELHNTGSFSSYTPVFIQNKWTPLLVTGEILIGQFGLMSHCSRERRESLVVPPESKIQASVTRSQVQVSIAIAVRPPILDFVYAVISSVIFSHYCAKSSWHSSHLPPAIYGRSNLATLDNWPEFKRLAILRAAKNNVNSAPVY